MLFQNRPKWLFRRARGINGGQFAPIACKLNEASPIMSCRTRKDLLSWPNEMAILVDPNRSALLPGRPHCLSERDSYNWSDHITWDWRVLIPLRSTSVIKHCVWSRGSFWSFALAENASLTVYNLLFSAPIPSVGKVTQAVAKLALAEQMRRRLGVLSKRNGLGQKRRGGDRDVLRHSNDSLIVILTWNLRIFTVPERERIWRAVRKILSSHIPLKLWADQNLTAPPRRYDRD
jgi:hypothetical protein